VAFIFSPVDRFEGEEIPPLPMCETLVDGAVPPSCELCPKIFVGIPPREIVFDFFSSWRMKSIGGEECCVANCFDDIVHCTGLVGFDMGGNEGCPVVCCEGECSWKWIIFEELDVVEFEINYCRDVADRVCAHGMVAINIPMETFYYGRRAVDSGERLKGFTTIGSEIGCDVWKIAIMSDIKRLFFRDELRERRWSKFEGRHGWIDFGSNALN
jgi:hypothetical protein